MKCCHSTLALHLLTVFGLSLAQLPTVYEYYTADGISSGLSVDQPYFTLNGKNITIYSGAMHYFRVPPQYWRDRLRKLRATGLNAVETYIAWNIHEPRSGVFEFGSGGTDMEMFADLATFLTIAKEEDLLVIARPGPYICAEWEWGGFPSWLLQEEGIRVRSSDAVFMGYVERYLNQLLAVLAPHQFTQGGSIIAVQVENEYGYTADIDKVYLQELVDIIKGNNITELLVTSDGAGSRTAGSLPGVLFQTVNFGSDPVASFSILEEIQPGQPLMVMEHYPGWFDHWTEGHSTKDDNSFLADYEAILAYPASSNLYMFHGGTNWGFLNGANIGPGDNSGFQPTTTSYDYDAPLSEAGDYTAKYFMIRDLIQQYNPIQTLTPDVPELVERQEYSTIPITDQLSYNGVVGNIREIVLSSEPLPMEKLPIHDYNGQSYGYLIYRETDLNIPANSVLRISGHIHDTVMVLINGSIISNPLSNNADLNNFGYWRLENSTFTFPSIDIFAGSLDLVVENWGRANFGNLYYQFKGLLPENHVYLNDEELSWWLMYPLEFQTSWTNDLSDWTSVEGSTINPGPGLYKATLTLDAAASHTDTFIDMRAWKKGVVIVNGFVLGRYTFLGPQQALYLPAPFLHSGDNEIVIFEHFQPAAEVRFSTDPIFSNP